MKHLRHRICLVLISLLFIIGNLVIARQTDAQVQALKNVSNNNKAIIDRVNNDKTVSDKIISEITAKEAEVLIRIKNGDIEALRSELTTLRVEIDTLYKEFSSYKQLYEQKKISEDELETYMNSTNQRISSLDSRIKILEGGLQALDSTLQDRIRTEIGDINVLKEQIRQEVIQELMQAN